MREIWKDIPGYEGLYQASNQGNIRNPRTMKVLRPAKNPQGYLTVSLTKDGVWKTKIVHGLVMLAFRGLSEGRDTDHINSVRTDNMLSNIEYVSRRENMRRHHIKKGYVGAYKSNRIKNPWRAMISIDNKLCTIGSFPTREKAVAAYNKKVKALNTSRSGEKV